MTTLLFLVTTIATALIAGLFYGYSCSVNTGLGRLSDADYLKAMQSINRAILNPLFFMSFMGTLILLPLSTWSSYHGLPASRFYYFLGASLVYAIGVFGVTMAGNVPLNEALDKFDIDKASPAQIAMQRLLFEKKWNLLHTIRTIANVVSLTLAILGCMAKVK